MLDNTKKKQNKTKQNKTKQNKTKQNKTKQNKTKQNKTKQNKTKQNKTKQNKTKQNKTKQNKTKQNKKREVESANTSPDTGGQKKNRCIVKNRNSLESLVSPQAVTYKKTYRLLELRTDTVGILKGFTFIKKNKTKN